MRLGLNLGYSGAGMKLNVDLVRRVEALGFDSVWSAEAYGSDAVSPLAYLAALTQKIRQKVVADDSLSMLAQNVKIITVDGVVTLRGPVNSAEEKERIAAVATEVAGAGKVKDNLEVAQ